MKRYFGLLAFAILFGACDDGDITFEEIDFDTVNTARCGNKLYKVNGNEALIVNVQNTEAEFNAIFAEEPTGSGLPQSININGADIQVAYRLFNGTVGSESICDAIPPINPAAVEDWTATSGFMQITTTAMIVENTATGFEGGQKINQYRHNIIFTDIEFDRSNGTTQLYPVFNFGSFDRDITHALPRPFLQQLNKCDGSNVIYKTSGDHAMVLAIDAALINGSTLDTPQLANVDGTTTSFSYLIYDTAPLTSEHFCDAVSPANPIQVWQGTGQVEVTSTDIAGDIQHTIVLKDIVLRRNNSEFILATNYNFGTFLVEN